MEAENSLQALAEKKEKSRKKKDQDSYFEGHTCVLSPQQRKKYELKCNAFVKFIIKLIAVDKSNVRARRLFKSYAALQHETYRQFTYYPVSIHPFSKLRFWLEATTVINLILINIFVTLFYCDRKRKDSVFEKSPRLHLIESILESMYILIIIANCFTGYVENDYTVHVILDFKKTFWKYVKTYFFIDIFSILGIYNTYNILEKWQPISVTWSVIFDSAKLLRTPTLFKYTNNIMKVKKVGIRKKSAIRVALLLYTYLQWNIFFQFAVEYYTEKAYYPAHPSNCSWMTTSHIWNGTLATKFVYGLYRAVAMLRENTSLINSINNTGCFEYFFMISWITAKLMVLNGAFIYMIKAFGLESARAKYFMMAKQVKTYMEHRKFPPRLKKKILKFYAIRFQSQFFVESRMIACMSGQLREDILMHSGRQLISDVEFLKTLPRSLHLQIGSKLSIVIFIAGDIIFKINTPGDCMYFIDRGTVAIYSESGKEVCHLDDGDFFGEIALVMKQRFRTASVVAVSNCELFRLDRVDFESSIACYPTVYEEIKKVAINRFERTMVMDDHHRSEIRQDTEGKGNDNY